MSWSVLHNKWNVFLIFNRNDWLRAFFVRMKETIEKNSRLLSDRTFGTKMAYFQLVFRSSARSCVTFNSLHFISNLHYFYSTSFYRITSHECFSHHFPAFIAATTKKWMFIFSRLVRLRIMSNKVRFLHGFSHRMCCMDGYRISLCFNIILSWFEFEHVAFWYNKQSM